MAFFQRWWRVQNATTHAAFRRQLARGQWEFVGGGWVENDEQTTMYGNVINQLMEGHGFIQATFPGTRVRCGWQIDAFGPSTMTPVFAALMGLEYHVVGRLPYDRHAALLKRRDLQFVWRPSPSFPEVAILTENLWRLYVSPQSFNFDQHPRLNPPVTPDNIAARAALLVREMRDRAPFYRTPLLLATWGFDFDFQDAPMMFASMDPLVAHINADPARYGNATFRYATVSQYFDALAQYVQRAQGTASPVAFSTLADADLAPYHYLPLPDSFWSGYYASRPALKADVRLTDQGLAAAELLCAMARARDPGVASEAWMDALVQARRNTSILMHHDAVTGTAEQPVVDDYAQMLHTARGLCSRLSAASLQRLLAPNATAGAQSACAATVSPISVFEPLLIPTAPNAGDLLLTLFNPVAQGRVSMVTLPMDPDALFSISAIFNLQSNSSSSFSSSSSSLLLTQTFGTNLYTTLPSSALQIQTLGTNLTQKSAMPPTEVPMAAASDWILQSAWLSVGLCPDTLLLCWMYDHSAQQNHSITMDFLSYASLEDNPYVFRPRGPARPLVTPASRSRAASFRTPSSAAVVAAINVTFALPFRLSYQVELAQQPVDIARALVLRVEVSCPENHEIIARFQLDAAQFPTQDIFTDDSGMQLQSRIFDPARPPAGNYFSAPTTLKMMSPGNLTFTLVSQQTHGVASMLPGAVEAMLHRRQSSIGFPPLLPTPLNDTTTSRRVFVLSLLPSSAAEQFRHVAVAALNNAVQAFALVQPASGRAAGFIASGCLPSIQPLNPLPENVELLSLSVIESRPQATLLRLRHTYQTDVLTDASLKAPVPIDLDGLFLAPFGLASCSSPQLMTLQGNSQDFRLPQWPSNGNNISALQSRPSSSEAEDSQNTWILNPLHILTFICKFFG